jgi:hypothetical protein
MYFYSVKYKTSYKREDSWKGKKALNKFKEQVFDF